MSGNMPQVIERFLREGEALRRLNHPNIVKVLATVDDDNQHYIVMEYVGGGTLADLLYRERPLALGRVVAISLELSDALSRAHHLHILHRDIKPGNILMAEDGTPRLTDFGLARIGQLPSLTESRTILGTLGYISPEVLEGREASERSDIWSFGVVLYEMVTGQLPFGGESAYDCIWSIKNQPLPILENMRDGIPASLASLIRRMLRKDSGARVESVRQVGAELENIQKELGSSPDKVGKTGIGAEKDQNSAHIIRVLIADDHAVVRQGLRMFIDLQEDMQVVGEGTNGSEAIELAARLNPDVVLLDLVMPQLGGVEATARIKQVCPQAHLMILTSFGEDDQVIPALQAGAQGYLLKDIRPEELVKAVREAYQGKTQLDSRVAQKLINLVSGNNLPPKPNSDTG
ncbi:MAG: protein kinase [Anaerolineae bacterium]|nr:protein kinase [Anaerolineae bacterium]